MDENIEAPGPDVPPQFSLGALFNIMVLAGICLTAYLHFPHPAALMIWLAVGGTAGWAVGRPSGTGCGIVLGILVAYIVSVMMDLLLAGAKHGP